MVRTFRRVRAAGVLAIAVVSLVGWMVARTLERARDSTDEIVHSQEVLAATASVLGTLVDAEAGTRGFLVSANRRDLDALDRADRHLAGAVDRLGLLTAADARQQARVQTLRGQTAQALRDLHGLATAPPGGAPVSPAAIASQRASLDTARGTLRAIQLEEGTLLGSRVDGDRAALTRLRWILAAVGLAAAGLIALVVWRLAREASRHRRGADVLRDTAADLEARWRAVIESAVDGIIVIDAHGRIEAFNPAAERLFGYAASEVAGLNVKTLMPSPYHEEHDTYLSRYVATGMRKIIGTGREVTGRRKDGTTFPLHLSVGEMNVHGERKFTGIVHDLESRVRMEGQLREQSTLARLGEMAAVIAHEVRNPLAGIRAAMQVIGGRLPAGSRDVETIAQVVARIDALNNLMKDLLMFARPPTPRVAPVDPRALVTATADLLDGDPAFRNVRVVIAGDTPPILADPELLQIVFVNLLFNAAHAMPDGGTIDVLVTATDETCRIAFTDQGPGIPPEIRDRLFTPFVTTKARGTGLGLSTAKRLIEAHRGSITVSGPDAGGTTVTVHLPAGFPSPPAAGP